MAQLPTPNKQNGTTEFYIEIQRRPNRIIYRAIQDYRERRNTVEPIADVWELGIVAIAHGIYRVYGVKYSWGMRHPVDRYFDTVVDAAAALDILTQANELFTNGINGSDDPYYIYLDFLTLLYRLGLKYGDRKEKAINLFSLMLTDTFDTFS